MFAVEGYKMFSGILKVKPYNKEPYRVLGVFLYKPDTDCWYGRGKSYPAEICEVVEDFIEQEVYADE
jgi:hypothetical protein